VAIANGEKIELLNSLGQWQLTNTKATLAHISGQTIPPERYRVKPKVVNINGYEVPLPVREPLEDSQEYYVAIPKVNVEPMRLFWNSDKYDKHWLECGLVHMTEEAANLHIKAILSFTKLEKGEAL
jgi:hypothetical protein